MRAGAASESPNIGLASASLVPPLARDILSIQWVPPSSVMNVLELSVHSGRTVRMPCSRSCTCHAGRMDVHRQRTHARGCMHIGDDTPGGRWYVPRQFRE